MWFSGFCFGRSLQLHFLPTIRNGTKFTKKKKKVIWAQFIRKKKITKFFTTTSFLGITTNTIKTVRKKKNKTRIPFRENKWNIHRAALAFDADGFYFTTIYDVVARTLATSRIAFRKHVVVHGCIHYRSTTRFTSIDRENTWTASAAAVLTRKPDARNRPQKIITNTGPFRFRSKSSRWPGRARVGAL